MTVAHNRVYTIGKSFRYERKVTTRHLWEFTLVEFEVRNLGLSDLMDHIEQLFKAAFDSVRGEAGVRDDIERFIEPAKELVLAMVFADVRDRPPLLLQ